MGNLKAIGVFDGRYKRYVKEFENIFSEYGLMKRRVEVEIKWLFFLSYELKLFEIEKEDREFIENIYKEFNLEDAKHIKKIEKKTNHDVKAVEYFIKKKLDKIKANEIKEWVHFGCTSEDINNNAYALMIKEGKKIIADYLDKDIRILENFAKKYKDFAMISRTHGQPASPTTVGKEFTNFAFRLKREFKKFHRHEVEGKINGASGNYNAHNFVFDNIDWIKESSNFIDGYLHMKPLLFSTQINNYSYISELMHIMIRIASIVIDIDRDIWGYISFNYIKQKVIDEEVGSSTMPHKVNPIDFENSEGNMGLVISQMHHLSTKLLNSRFQRDLTDSTVLRNLGTIFSHMLLALKKLHNGLNKIEINKEKIKKDLEENLELLAEPIQSVMRVYKEEEPYEKLKELTRGKKITREDIDNFVNSLNKVPDFIKAKMKKLTPEKYTGIASRLVDKYFEEQ